MYHFVYHYDSHCHHSTNWKETVSDGTSPAALSRENIRKWHLVPFESLPTALESTFSSHVAQINQRLKSKEAWESAHLSERVDLGDLCLKHFVDYEGM
jgi:hypothetical protein